MCVPKDRMGGRGKGEKEEEWALGKFHLFALKRWEESRRSEIIGQGRKRGARFEETRKPFSHKKEETLRNGGNFLLTSVWERAVV